jgi:excisionase family DNA binding protein
MSGAEEEVLTVKEAARQLRVSKWLVYELFKRGELPGFRVGSNVRIRAAGLDDYVRRTSNRLAATTPPPASPPGRRRPTSPDGRAAYRFL